MHNRAVCRWVGWEWSGVQSPAVAILVKSNSARNFERCLDVAWVLSMTLKGSYGTPRRALLAQTGV